MKSILIISAFVLSALTLTSCFDEKDVVAEIAIPTDKGYYPVSGNTFTDLINGGTISANRSYAKGTNIRFELQYWSLSPVKEINLYQTIGTFKSQVMNHPYASAYSRLKSCDTLLIDYTMPASGATAVKLDVEIVNQNALTLVRTLTVKTP